MRGGALTFALRLRRILRDVRKPATSKVEGGAHDIVVAIHGTGKAVLACAHGERVCYRIGQPRARTDLS